MKNNHDMRPVSYLEIYILHIKVHVVTFKLWIHEVYKQLLLGFRVCTFETQMLSNDSHKNDSAKRQCTMEC